MTYNKRLSKKHSFAYFSSDIRKKIVAKFFETPFVDTHEHLIEEKDRLSGTTHPEVRSDE